MMEKEIKAFDEWISKNYTDNEQKFNSLVQYHDMETTSAFYSGYHNRDEELTRLQEENERLRKALEWVQKTQKRFYGYATELHVEMLDFSKIYSEALNAEQGGE